MKKHFLAVVFAIQAVSSTVIADDEPEMVGEEGLLTNWSTFLADGVDIGWQGTWILESATVVAPNGTIQAPSAGHTLTVDYHGNYSLDYSTAYFLESIQINTGAFSGSVATVPPAGVMPPGVPENCAYTGQIYGLVSGQLFAPFDIDLDRLNPDGSAVYGLPWMEAALDPGVSQMPYIECPGAEVTVKSTGSVLPIGAGRGATTQNGQVVPYDYEMDEALTTLTIKGQSVPRLIYIFRKAT